MSQNTLSVSEVGKSSALLQAGAGSSQSSGEASESDGFLSVLGSIFSSETEGTEKGTEDVKNADKAVGESLEATEAEGDGESATKLLELEGDLTEGEEVDSDPQGNKNSLETELEPLSKGEKKVSETMSEGSALLERLDESNQALKNDNSGKELPQKLAQESKQHLEDGQNKVSKFIESDSVKLKTAGDEAKIPEDLVSKYVQVKGTDTKELSETDADSLKQITEKFEALEKQQVKVVEGETPDTEQVALQMNNKVVQLDTEEHKSEDIDVSALAVSQLKAATSVNTPNTQATKGQDKKEPISPESLIWETGKTASAVGVGAALHAAEPLAVQAAGVSATAVELPIETSLTQQILSKDPSELTEEELQILAQASSNAAAVQEVAKQVPDSVKSAAMSSSAYALNQQSQAQQYQTLQQQAQLASQQAEKAVAQQISQPVSTNPNAIPVDVSHLSAQQMQTVNSANRTANNAAMLASMTAAGAAGAMAAKSKEKDKDLSQQLAGIAGQQGVQQAQIRSEVQQAAAQSPLQLAREVGGEQLAERVQMMMSKNLKNVDIRLDPPELGRMQIRMSMNGDMASVQFTVSNPQARDMVEHAMPRLREMLSQQGIQLADSSVQQQNSGRQQQEYAAGNNSNGNGLSGGSSAEDELNLDEAINLNANIASKDDGISYYA
ncbi:flagellar hook-length control protein FliK [Vibrio sp. HN007]|uniref:flagellar hook-length control protein FliK n=1 Tax=Vibrio iocasae TaxID=3098914 RepID=UPI0035D45586